MNIAQHIERARNLFPDKSALIFENRSFTYRELDDLSNRVANGLLAQGISPGDRAALFLPNIPEFVLVSLGIFRMGAVAVSLNSTLKAEETKFILDDCQAKLVVTTAALRGQLPVEELPHLQTVVIAEGEGAPGEIALDDWLAEASPQAVGVDLPPEASAIILYTSGTTGFPKGAVLSHGNIVSNVGTCVRALGIGPDERVLLCLPIFHSFGQTAVLHPCLEAGATLILHREFEIGAILDSISTQGITLFYGVPSLYTILLDSACAHQLQSVRGYVSAAATLPPALARRWQEKFGVAIREGYGATETSLTCFNHRMQFKPGSVGLPLEGIEIKVVDGEGREVAADELGELVVRGPNVMLGYWDRPTETAGAIRDGWFHTGDMGKKDQDGYFYILDRIKDMINVGGIKAYPSEIEKVLHEHPAVSEAAVYGVMDDTLGEQVRASIVLKPNGTETPEEIIQFCRQRMADFKVPSTIYFVDALPKGRTGKILKPILREKAQEEDAQKGPQQDAPQGMQEPDRPLTEPLSEIWASVLGVEKVGLDDNFFALGGNSFLATRITLQVQTILGVALSIRHLFEAPTVAELARRMESERLNGMDNANGNGRPAPILEAVPRRGGLALSFFQQEIWLMATQSEEQNRSYVVQFMLRIQGKPDTAILRTALDEMIRRHEMLRTVFRQSDDDRVEGEPVQVVLPESGFPLSIIQVLAMKADREGVLKRVANQEIKRSFDLSTGPLARASLLQMGYDAQVLLITMHHIIIDIWSVEIFKRELALLYNAFLKRKPSPLPELTIQYADFAHWQRRAFTQEQSEARLAYWEKWLATEPPPLELPLDRPRPPVETFLSRFEWFHLSPETTGKLLDLAKASESTLFMMMMTAFAMVICRWSAQPEIVVGVPFSNRNHRSLESSIGLFAQTLLIRIDTGADSGNNSGADGDFLAVLARVRAAYFSALANQDIPQRHFINRLQPERDFRRRPPYHVMLNFMPNDLAQPFQLGSNTVIPSELDNKIRPDLLLNFWEEGEGAQSALRGMWRYKTELFEAATIAGVARRFLALIEGVVANPHLSWEEFPVPART